MLQLLRTAEVWKVPKWKAHFECTWFVVALIFLRGQQRSDADGGEVGEIHLRKPNPVLHDKLNRD